jgi:hypothetical protein
MHERHGLFQRPAVDFVGVPFVDRQQNHPGVKLPRPLVGVRMAIAATGTVCDRTSRDDKYSELKSLSRSTATQSKNLRTGIRVCWLGNVNDSGQITETSWDAVTIAWDNQHVAVVTHRDMRDVHWQAVKPPEPPLQQQQEIALRRCASP